MIRIRPKLARIPLMSSPTVEFAPGFFVARGGKLAVTLKNPEAEIPNPDASLADQLKRLSLMNPFPPIN